MCAEQLDDFNHFVGIEEYNVITSMANLGEKFFLIYNLDLLYRNCTKLKQPLDDPKLKLPAFFYLITNSEFCFAMISFLRKHRSKSFLSLRVALDYTFTTYYLLKYPEKEGVYLAGDVNAETGEKNNEWYKIFFNIKNTIKNKPEDFPLATALPAVHELCSKYAHSDAMGIMHRFKIDREKSRLEATYFDYDKTGEEYIQSFANLLTGFFSIFMIYWELIFKNMGGTEVSAIETAIQNYALRLRNYFPSDSLG